MKFYNNRKKTHWTHRVKFTLTEITIRQLRYSSQIIVSHTVIRHVVVSHIIVTLLQICNPQHWSFMASDRYGLGGTSAASRPVHMPRCSGCVPDAAMHSGREGWATQWRTVERRLLDTAFCSWWFFFVYLNQNRLFLYSTPTAVIRSPLLHFVRKWNSNR
jgi:hypothetical protein